MAGVPITHFQTDPDKLAVIYPCMENYGVGEPDAEWPNNILSRQAVVYGSGRIARQEVPVHHAVDVDELALCQRLAALAASITSGMEVGMGSASSDPFHEFFVVANGANGANGDEEIPGAIDEHLIRSRFGGTIFPPATITVEPLTEAGVWWSEVDDGSEPEEEYLLGSESKEEYLLPWRAMIQWFRDQPAFVDSAFVCVGDDRALWAVPVDQWPPGTEMPGSALPRLVLGLTLAGSLVGLFGFSVKT